MELKQPPTKERLGGVKLLIVLNGIETLKNQSGRVEPEPLLIVLNGIETESGIRRL